MSKAVVTVRCASESGCWCPHLGEKGECKLPDKCKDQTYHELIKTEEVNHG